MAALAGGHAGIARYAAALTESLDRVAPAFGDLRLEAVTHPSTASRLTLKNIRVRSTALPFGAGREGWSRLVGEQLEARRRGCDLVHFFDLIGPVLSRRRFVATVHDAAITHDFGFPPLRRGYKRRLQPWALAHAEAIVAVSEFARDEAVQRMGGDPARIRVIHSGPGLIAGDGAVRPEAPTPYLLSVGTVADNKNLPFLVRAYDAAGVDADLVLAGRRGQSHGEVEAAISALGSSARIRLVEDASDATLDALYRGAIALVHPSVYEGFGFPPLEAMARGCPVLLSDIPALREVSGDGGMLLPVDDAVAWSTAMRQVVGDETLRAELRRRGFETAARFSWDETARRLCELFLELGRAR